MSNNTTNNQNNKKRKGPRIPPEVAAQYFSHLSSSGDPPCSPEEVKQLMSMFAEIMGMEKKGANSNGSGGSATNSSSVSFMFGGKDGWPPSALAAAARAASMYMPPEEFLDYDDDDEDDDDDDDDDYDDDEDDDYDDAAETKRPAIEPGDWKKLEQVARDETLEEEEKARKAAKKREKKQRKKERAKREAAEKAAEGQRKKQEKLVLSWKSRVVAAAQADDDTKLQALLNESPFKTAEEAKEHAEYLLPNCIGKTRDAVEEGNSCRVRLAEFVFSSSCLSGAFAFSIVKNGRNLIHMSCFVGDFYFVQCVLEHCDDTDDVETRLNETCDESGLAAIHYAVLSGSKQMLEILFSTGKCNLETCSNERKLSRNGKGVTALQLAETILSNKHTTQLKSMGSVLDEVTEQCLSKAEDRRRYHSYLRQTIARLSHVADQGYSPVLDASQKKDEPEQDQQSLVSKSKKKKKKKKQAPQPAVPLPVPVAPPKAQEDPMIAALEGMGFTRDQIEAAAKAYGGTDNATADDLIMWIFAQQAGEELPIPVRTTAAELEPATHVPSVQEVTISPEEIAARAEKERADALKKAEEARLAQQRLLAKKEEQRRRNREWNKQQVAQVKLQSLSTSRVAPHQTSFAGHTTIPQPSTTVTTTIPPRKLNGVHQAPNISTIGGVPPGGPIKILNRPKAVADGSAPAMGSVKKHPPGMDSIAADFTYVGSSGAAEDATVSSLGSGMVAQNEWMNESESYAQDAPVLEGFQGVGASQPPPGFQFGGSQQLSPETSCTGSDPLAAGGEVNATGEIRATAKAFVPTNFNPPPGLAYGPLGYPVPVLSTIGESGHGPPKVDPITSLLPGGFQSQYHPQSNGFERVVPIASQSPAPSVTSSVTGFSDDFMPPLAGLAPALGYSDLESDSAPIGSLLDGLDIAHSGDTGSALWGGGIYTQGVSQLSGVAGAPVGGFPSLSQVPVPALDPFSGAFGRSSDQENKNNRVAAGWGGTTGSSIW